jgi:Icc protein
MSDLHVGEGLFRPDLLTAAVQETNELGPDLVVVAGDLTMEGYRGEFERCRQFLDELACRHVVVAMGNHDARNVGYRHFEDVFGPRDSVTTVPVGEGRAKVVTIDSTKPDLDEGEVGREHYGWLDAELRGWTAGPRIVVIHHHILAVPGTGRDVNNLRDAGDVMAILRELDVDLVLSGHRHVPYVWSISGVRVVHSGTVSTLRVRGTMPPSYNVIELDAQEVRITMRQPGRGVDGEEPLARFARVPVTTSEFYPALDRFVRYAADPFATTIAPTPSAPVHPTPSVEAIAPTPSAQVQPTPSVEATAPARETGPTIIALLEGGPLAGRRFDAEVVEGRPPKTIDVEADDGSMCRYCLAEWTQAGPSAVYTFLYVV